MHLEQFKLELIETYNLEGWCPRPLGLRDKRFEDFTYTKWAVKELFEYVSESLYPETSATKQEFCELVNEFMLTMDTYSTSNKNTAHIFRTAYLIAADVLNWLEY